MLTFPSVNRTNLHSPDFSHQRSSRRPPSVSSSVLEHIGNTPLVRLHNLERKYSLSCRLYAKCEFFNSGGSIKDRIGLRMVEEAEKAGLITPNKTTIIEPTSGNTGIGLALAACVKGYKCIIVMPMKMSLEKVNLLKALGAQIVRTPTEASYDDPRSHINVAKRLNNEIKDSVILDQYRNPYNPIAHYDSTGSEIIEQMKDKKVDVFVAGAGTGGTITGTSTKLRESNKDLIVVGVDPHGSILAEPASLNDVIIDEGYKVEGIGYDFVPDVLDRKVVDKWIKTNDKEAFEMALNLIRTEGILCGGSSGSAMYAAVEYAKNNVEDNKNVVVILPDSIRNYMSKFLDSSWMENNNIINPNVLEDTIFKNKKVKDLDLKDDLVTLDPNTRITQTIDKIQNNEIMPIIENNEIIGILTMDKIHNYLLKGNNDNDITIKNLLNIIEQKNTEEIEMVTQDTRLSKVDLLIKNSKTVVVVINNIPKHIISKKDLVKFLLNRKNQ